MNKIILYVIIYFCLSSCTIKGTETKTTSDKIAAQKFNNRLIRDTGFYKKINDDISINRNGDIGYKFISKPECDTCKEYEYYVTAARITNQDKKSEIRYDEMPLKKLIDTGSLQILSSVFFLDKFHAYSVRMNYGGGHVYQIEGADAATFRIYSDSLYYMAYDKNYFYDHDYRLTVEEAKGLKREKE